MTRFMSLVSVMGVAALGLVVLGADPAWAAEESFLDGYWWKTIWRIINFLILAAVIFKVARDPAKAFFTSKKEEAEKVIRELEQAKAQAEKELADLKAKLANADQEIEDIVAQLKSLAARNRERILADAKKMSEETMAQAKLTAESELAKAKASLMDQSFKSVINLASAKLADRLTETDHQLLVDQALNDMESSTVH